MLATQAPYAQFFDTDGSPLDGGKIYFGTANADPESSPITVYWDAAGTIPAAQPISTLNGYAMRSGSPATVYTPGNYSMRVRNAQNVQVVYAPTADAWNVALSVDTLRADLASTAAGKGAAIPAFQASLSGTNARTVADELNETPRVSVMRYYVAGESDAGPMLQRALTACSGTKRLVFIPDGITLNVAQTLNAGNASIVGNYGRGATINYTGTTNLFNSIIYAHGIRFTGPGKSSTAICFKVQAGYRTLIDACAFDGWGKGIEISGSGQKVNFCTFDNCNYGVHVVKYPNNDATTTFTSEKNWYQTCNKGLFIDATGASASFQSSASVNDIFQINTGAGLHVLGSTFPFTVINPHTEQNSVSAGHYAFLFQNCQVIQVGGYQMGTDVNSFDANTYVHITDGRGIRASTKYRIANSNASVVAFEFDPATNIATIPANPSTQQIQFSAGGYGSTNAARYEIFGGYGDATYRFGHFVQSLRTSATGHGAVWSVGVITHGSPRTYTTLFNVDEFGNTYSTEDNLRTLGKAANRWSVVYAGTGAINTSDEYAKQDIGGVPDAWLDAWADVQWVRYKFRDAVATKGSAARWHTGLIAQRVEAAFAARGLDARELGLLCWDEWPEQTEVRDEDGNVVQPAMPAGERYGIRYEEALALEAALMRRTTLRLEQRLAALEGV